MQVHQFHPTPSFGDAIGNHLLSLQRILRDLGHDSEILCEQVPIHFEGQTRTIAQYAPNSSRENILLCHFSLSYSPQTMAWLGQIPDRKVILYHNITPHAYFAGINQVCWDSAQRGRRQLSELRQLAEAAWGVSGYNTRELMACGWERVGVLPIIFDSSSYAVRPSSRVLGRCRGGFNVLSVGRVSPNKCLEDVILTFAYLKRYVRPDARLLLVGSAGGMGPYLEFLQTLVSRLELEDVVFAGHVSTSELVAYYRRADVYLCMSEHEGFCVPLLESMHFDIPIVAYHATAIPETLGGSGILVRRKDHGNIAELIGLLADDEELGGRIVSLQRERLSAFAPESVRTQVQALLGALGV
jgi:glycosyltransferase involved in cell wall biosynthesis